MANKPLPTIPIYSDLLRDFIKESGYSLKRLAAEPEVDRDYKTLHRWLQRGEMPSHILFSICRVLNNIDPDCFIRYYS